MTDRLKEALSVVMEILVEEAPTAIEATITFEPGRKCTLEIQTRDFAILNYQQRL